MSATTRATGRLAPSPTGHLHLGHARSFLLAYWHTKSKRGRLVLRLEDVDVARASQAHVDSARRDLEWLGIEWDEERLQSAETERLRQAAEQLVERGLAYPCTCSRGDLRRAGALPGLSGELVYPGTCRGRFRSLSEAESRTGRQAGLRLIVNRDVVCFDDALYGPQQISVAREVGDFLILRRNKTPAYQLAVVVDDHRDGVSQVVRGSDLLSSTARQRLVQRALGLAAPAYAHLPLVCDLSGRRLAKREHDLGLTELRDAGVDPRVIVFWAAQTSGQLPIPSHSGQLQASELLPHFDLQRCPIEPTLLPADVIGSFKSASNAAPAAGP